jgi:hypothetical protein
MNTPRYNFMLAAIAALGTVGTPVERKEYQPPSEPSAVYKGPEGVCRCGNNKKFKTFDERKAKKAAKKSRQRNRRMK